MKPEVLEDGRRLFHFSCAGRGSAKVAFSAQVPVPLIDESLEDYAAMLCAENAVPCLARDDLRDELKTWLLAESTRYFDELGSAALNSVLEAPDSAASFAAILSDWNEAADRQAGLAATSSPAALEERRLMAALSGLVEAAETGALGRFTAKEARLAARLRKLLRERDWETERLRRKHKDVIDKAVLQLDDDDSGKESTQAASRHFAMLNRVEENYDKQIRLLREEQRCELRSFAVQLFEALEAGTQLPLEPEELNPPKEEAGPEADEVPLVTLDESYTIYLGAQLKTMHNLRLSAADGVATLCRSSAASSALLQGRRFQLALDLYGSSRQLSALLVLVGPKPTAHTTLRTPLYRACEASTEVHFPPFERQLEEAAASAGRLAEAGEEKSRRGEGLLAPGDVFLTRHSNLASVHVIFHLVVDDALPNKEITSRHPCIGGLRNIIRLCAKFGMSNLSLPLLLTDELSEVSERGSGLGRTAGLEEHTVQWCLKRAELVLKCVKGFLMEGAGGGAHTYNLGFLLPPPTPPPLFAQLAELLPQIYHLVGTKTSDLPVN